MRRLSIIEDAPVNLPPIPKKKKFVVDTTDEIRKVNASMMDIDTFPPFGFYLNLPYETNYKIYELFRNMPRLTAIDGDMRPGLTKVIQEMVQPSNSYAYGILYFAIPSAYKSAIKFIKYRTAVEISRDRFGVSGLEVLRTKVDILADGNTKIIRYYRRDGDEVTERLLKIMYMPRLLPQTALNKLLNKEERALREYMDEIRKCASKRK